MNINLAKEYRKAFETGAHFFSESFLIECQRPLTILMKIDQTANEAFATRFFWQTPDERTTFIGIGETAFFTPTDVMAMKSELSDYYYQGTPTILFGGFPFDEKGKDAPLWSELAQGGFVLPQILLQFDKESSQCEVILTCQRSNEFSEMETFFYDTRMFVETLFQKNVELSEILAPTCVSQMEIQVPEWITTVNQAVAIIRNANHVLDKIVLARQLAIEVKEPIALAAMMERLASQQPNTYLFLFEREGCAFIGATPERLLSATNDELLTAAVAGSIARGLSTIKDEQLGTELLNSAKNVHEHQIVVDRISNEMMPFVDGDVHVSERHLLKNRDIQHLYATITGKRKKGLRFVEMIQQLHPTPALGGEPKTAAMEWIKNHEPIGRGMYGAPIGWLSLAEDGGEFAVGIRSAVISKNHALLYAGCGIVRDSIAQEEREETKIKFEPMRRGLLGDVASKSHD